MEVAMVEAVLVSRYDGYSEANEYGNSKIWRRMQSGQKKVRCSSNMKPRF